MLWSHTRDILLKVERGILSYNIPICLEGGKEIRQINLRLNQDLLWVKGSPQILTLDLNNLVSQELALATKTPPYTV
jgi:hypothetical protein